VFLEDCFVFQFWRIKQFSKYINLNFNKMKNLIIFLAVLLIGLECVAQTQAVFPNYNSPSKDVLLKLDTSGTIKGDEHSRFLIESVNTHSVELGFIVNDSNVVWIYSCLSSEAEEVNFEEGDYQNSRWNLATQKMEKFVGHKWQGMCWVFRYNGTSFPLIKGDCGNVLFCKTFTKIPKQIPPHVVKNDTIYKTTVIIEQQSAQQPQQNYGYGNGVNTYIVGSGAVFTPYPDYNYYPQQNYGYGGCNNYQTSYGCGYNNYQQPHYGNNTYYNNSVSTGFGAVNSYPKPQPQPHSQPHSQPVNQNHSYGQATSFSGSTHYGPRK